MAPAPGNALSMIEIVSTDRQTQELPPFTPVVAEWMRRAFEAPTEAQRLAWPVIASGRNTLVFSPTGSGKTLAAFLWAINELVALGAAGALPAKPHIVYVSPLRALANDIERNLLSPLEQMRAISEESGEPFPDIRVAVRTGDTSARERQRMLRHPPQILITTPESLYLLLSSGFRRHLDQTRHVIVDEIHHLCGDKRGAHLIVTLERLAALVTSDAGGSEGFVRIGLSATQAPVEEIARFLVGRDDAGRERGCTVVDLGVRRSIDLQVIAPVPNLVEAKPAEVSEAIHEQLLDLIAAHRTTLVFCNSKHITERVAAKLNMMSEERGAGLRIGAHHGSMSRAFRLEMETRLKSGELRAIVATSSLELGIDIGHLDLVCQVESPKSVAAGLQRVGRAGHLLGLTSKGRIFATSRDDLVEIAVLAKGMLEGALDPVRIPENCLDVAAQQVASMAAVEGGTSEEMLRILRRAYSFRSLTREDFGRILQQLSGRWDDQELFEARTWLNWEAAADRVVPTRGALSLVRQNAGTIPEYAEYAVHAQDYERKLGTLDERFVQRLRPGQIFVLGARTWEFLRVDRNRVYVRDGRGRSPTIPRWSGPDYIPRSSELGAQVARFRDAVFSRLFDQPEGLLDWLTSEYPLDQSSAQQIIEYFVEEAHSLDTWPGSANIVAETFRNPLGHRQVVVHSPYGTGVNEAWAEALAQAARDEMQIELQATYSDDAFALHLPPDVTIPVEKLLSLVTSGDLDRYAESYVRESALFSVRFRHAAVRSLAVLRMRGGSKRPLWQQESESRRLQREVAELPLFPLATETVRECMEDHLDLPGLRRLLVELESGRLRLVSAEVDVPSPFGHGLLLAGRFGAVSEADRRERRAELLSLHREILKQILDEGSIRDLLDPSVVERFEARRQGTHETARARDAEELLQLMRRCGELSEDPGSELFIGRRARGNWQEWLRALQRERRAVPVALPRSAADARRWVASEDYPLYARAFAREARLGAHHQALLDAIRSGAAPTTRELRRETGEETDDLLATLEGAYRVVRVGGECERTRWAAADEWLPQSAPRRLGRLAARRAIILRVLRGSGPVAVEGLCKRYGLTPRAAEMILGELRETGGIQQGSFVNGRPAPQVCTRANLEELHRMALAALRREVEPVGLDRYVDFLLKWQQVHPKTNAEAPKGCLAVVRRQSGYGAYPRVWERDVVGMRVNGDGRAALASGIAGGDIRMGQFDLGQGRTRPLLAGVTFIPSDRSRELLEVPPTDRCSPEELAVLRSLRASGERTRGDIVLATGLAGSAVERALWQLFRRGLASNTDYAAIARCRWTTSPRWEQALLGPGDESDAHEPTDQTTEAEGADLDIAALRRAGLRSDEGRWYAVEDIADTSQDAGAAGRRCRARAMALMERYGIAARELLLAKSQMPSRDLSRGLRELFLRGQLLRGFFVTTFSGDQFALPQALERLRKERVARSEAAIMISSLDPVAVHLSVVRLEEMQNRPLATRYLVLHRGRLAAIVDVHPGEGRFLRVRDLRLSVAGARSPASPKRVAMAMLEYAVRWGGWDEIRITHVDGQPVSAREDVVSDFTEAGFRLGRGALTYRLRRRVGAAAETTLRRIVKTEEQKREDISLTSRAVLDFHQHIVTEYIPPPDKDMLVVFQCSVSRPFSKSPSHSSMRKAVRLATGKDPRADFEECRCHVVVLSSVIGPVPYEMENVYPADERGGGVKHMSPGEFDAAKPVLAERMAAYLRRWHDRYRIIATFTQGRYAEVMEEASELAGVEFPILPDMRGVRLKHGNQYWTRYWIQVFFELLKGMTDEERSQAMARLAGEQVEIDERFRPLPL